MSAIPTKNREVVKERSNNQCSRCGNIGSEMHHRMRRREGGHAVEILVWLCGDDHRWAHSNVTKAREAGYIIPTSVDNPADVPIKTFAGWAKFTPEGGIEWVST